MKVFFRSFVAVILVMMIVQQAIADSSVNAGMNNSSKKDVIFGSAVDSLSSVSAGFDLEF